MFWYAGGLEVRYEDLKTNMLQFFITKIWIYLHFYSYFTYLSSKTGSWIRIQRNAWIGDVIQKYGSETLDFHVFRWWWLWWAAPASPSSPPPGQLGRHAQRALLRRSWGDGGRISCHILFVFFASVPGLCQREWPSVWEVGNNATGLVVPDRSPKILVSVSVPDLGSGAFFWPLDQGSGFGMEKIRIRDPRWTFKI